MIYIVVKVKSIQEACAKCSVVHLSKFELFKTKQKTRQNAMQTQIIPCLSYCPAGIMVINMRSTRVKQFL